MSTLKKFISQIIAAVMLLTCSGAFEIAAAAEADSSEIPDYGKDFTIFDADNNDAYARFTARTQEEIANRYSAALYAAKEFDNEDPDTWYEIQPSLKYPYEPGMINESTRLAMLEMLNFYRWLMALDPAVEAETANREQLQTGALIRNFHYDHDVKYENKPSDMSDTMWKYGANDGNNFLNKNSSFTKPLDSIRSWMNEGYRIFNVVKDDEGNLLDMPTEKRSEDDVIAHRSLLLAFNLKKVSFAQSGLVTSGIGIRDDDKNLAEEVPFVAYPCPGYMPSLLVDPSVCAWSFELNPEYLTIIVDENDFFEKKRDYGYDESDLEGLVNITITNLSNGEVYKGGVVDVHERCLVFKQPDDYEKNVYDSGRFGYDDEYKVEIDGLTKVKRDEETDELKPVLPAKIVYTVKFFDMNATDRETHITSVDTYMKYSIPPQLMTDENIKYVTATLPETITAYADNQHQYSIPIDGEWSVDMENSCFTAKADEASLPANVFDKRGLLKHITIPFEQTDPNQAIYQTLEIVPSVVHEGEEVAFNGFPLIHAVDTMDVFRLIDIPDGSCEGIKVMSDYNSMSGEAFAHIDSASFGDSGKYIATFYTRTNIEHRVTTSVFVSFSPVELAVNTEHCNTDKIEPVKPSYSPDKAPVDIFDNMNPPNDPNNILSIERIDRIQDLPKYSIPSTMITEEGLRYISCILPDHVTIITKNNNYYSIPIKGEWVPDIEKSRFVAEIDIMSLPSHIDNPSALPDIAIINYEKTPVDCYDWLEFKPACVNVGETVEINGSCFISEADTMDVFKLIDLPNDDLEAVQIFTDRNTVGGYGKASFDSVTSGDSGKYISVFYKNENVATATNSLIYVSNAISELSVNAPCKCEPNESTTTITPTEGEHIMYGDVTLDNKITLVDVITLQKHLSGSLKLSDKELKNADSCQDGAMNQSDVSAILKYITEEITSLPIKP